VVIGVATLTFNVDYGDFLGRFGTDVEALSDRESGEVGIGAGGEVSLGKYERLGNRRVGMWADALSDILQRDVLGILLGEFARSVAHSDFIDVLARNGVVGFLLYIMLMTALPLRAWSQLRRAQSDSSRTLHFMAFALLVAYLLYSFPFRPLNYTTTSWYMWVIVGLSMARITVVRRQAARASGVTTRDDLAEPVDAAPLRGSDLWRPASQRIAAARSAAGPGARPGSGDSPPLDDDDQNG
jgi:hypothetical protein